jgi:hypothetical protein
LKKETHFSGEERHFSAERKTLWWPRLNVPNRAASRQTILAAHPVPRFLRLASNVGSNGTRLGFNLDNWFENVGPLSKDQRHTLNLSGLFELPRRFQLSFSTAYYSTAPFSANVAGTAPRHVVPFRSQENLSAILTSVDLGPTNGRALLESFASHSSICLTCYSLRGRILPLRPEGFCLYAPAR